MADPRSPCLLLCSSGYALRLVIRRSAQRLGCAALHRHGVRCQDDVPSPPSMKVTMRDSSSIQIDDESDAVCSPARHAERFVVCEDARAGEIPSRYGVLDLLSAEVVEWHLSPSYARERAGVGNRDPAALGDCSDSWGGRTRGLWTGEVQPTWGCRRSQ